MGLWPKLNSHLFPAWKRPEKETGKGQKGRCRDRETQGETQKHREKVRHTEQRDRSMNRVRKRRGRERKDRTPETEVRKEITGQNQRIGHRDRVMEAGEVLR